MMELHVVEIDGATEWTADVEGAPEPQDIVNNIGGDTKFLIFQGADDGTVVVNLNYVKRFSLTKKEEEPSV